MPNQKIKYIKYIIFIIWFLLVYIISTYISNYFKKEKYIYIKYLKVQENRCMTNAYVTININKLF